MTDDIQKLINKLDNSGNALLQAQQAQMESAVELLKSFIEFKTLERSGFASERVERFYKKGEYTIGLETTNKFKEIAELFLNGDMDNVVLQMHNLVYGNASKPRPRNSESAKNDKNIILMNSVSLGEPTTKLNVGTWSVAEQNKFLKNLKKSELQDCKCRCDFCVEYDNTCIANIGPGYIGPQYETANSTRHNSDNEFVFIMQPIIADVNYPSWYAAQCAKCGITSYHDCPKYIQDGKCTSPFIRKTIGEVLFPEKYNKQR